MRPRNLRFLAALLGIFLLALAWTAQYRAAIEGINWFPIGPAPGHFGSFPGGISGRATAVAANPANANDIWLGTSQGGVWHSTDGGSTWAPKSDDQPSLAIGSLALAGCGANGCTSIYAGTGENAIRRDTFYGKGLLVGSVDGPDVFWSNKTGTPYSFKHGSIYNVVLDPTTSGSGQIVYVTLSSGVTASASESTVTAPEPTPGGYGVYKSSTNGNSWSKLTIPGADGYRPTDLEMHPTNSMVLYAGYLGRGIFKSTDGGANWCPLNKGVPKPGGCPNVNGLPNVNNTTFDHVEIALFRTNPDILYASFGHCPNRLLDACSPDVYKSTDGGSSWTQTYVGTELETSNCPNGYTRYTHVLTVHPTTSTTLFLGGIRLCKSINSGATWSLTDTNTLGGVSTHFDHHSVIFHQTDASRAYNVNDGGIVTSADGGNTWTPRNGNIQSIGFQSIASSPLTARVIGGAQDNTGQMWTGLSGWETLPCCGDGGFSIMDLDNVMRMYVTTNVPNPFSVVPTRSSDGGASFGDAINAGLNTTDPRSFYSPFIQDRSAPHPLYFGTNRLFKSTNDAANWSAVSPVLSTTPTTDDILFGQDVITAIAVAPNNPNRIYVGYYSGKVFVTNSACANACPGIGCCWSETDSGLPAAPITWIAVDPGNPDLAYATLSGFFAGIHVYKTTNGGVSWTATAPHGDLNGVPANTILVEPSAPTRLWLGTDIGIYKSHTSGGSWFRHSTGLPRVPVFEISMDESRGRVFAGTHGRGAFILTSPFLSNFEGWVDDQIWDIPVYGSGFLSNQNCTLKILRQNSTVCASGTVDAIGGTIKTDAGGVLVTTKGGFWNGKPVAWACLNGQCVGGASIASCNQPGNKVAAVIAICGPQVGIDLITGCPPVTSPPSSWISLTGLGGFLAASGEEVSPQALPAGAFQLLPTLQTGNGTSETLCSVNVPIAATDTPPDVLKKARDAVNASAICIAKGVSAEILPAIPTEEEDLFPGEDNLKLLAPGLTGGQLVPSLHAAPGQATGICFSMNKLGIPVGNQVRIMRARFETAAGGAAGGAIELRERSGLGNCAIRVPLPPGGSANDIAQAVEAAFQAPGIPGPNPNCPADVNPRDVNRHGNGHSVVTVLPTEVEVCLEDPQVGISLAPEEVCFTDLDCDDGNPCTRDTCNTQTGQCKTTPEPDGLPCQDGDLCTVGATCTNGICGTRVTCNDQNLCTDDVCDPLTGRCLNPPVACDDGNVCTRDSCVATTGQCRFETLAGQACDDGNLCTSHDLCVQTPGTNAPSCQGSPACADTDPCTVDACDPATGACLNQVLDCNDGNPCTVDSCANGLCRADPVFGIACEDGSLCTVGDACGRDATGAPACIGAPVNCSDGDVCTADVCDEATGACRNPRLPLSLVTGHVMLSNDKMSWSPTPDASHWNTYRGTIPAAGLGSRTPPYDHVCFESDDAAGDGALVSVDPENPRVGSAYYYVITGEGTCGESAPGVDSDLTPRPLPFPCPTPP